MLLGMHLPSGWLGYGPLLLRGACCLLVGLVVYGYHPLQKWRYRKLPGPPPRWLIGNLGQIIKFGYPKALQQWAQQYGPVFKVWQGGNVLIVVEDPAAARAANLHNHDRPSIFFNFVGEERRFDDAGMLLAEGDKYWQSLKHAWQAMFHPTSLRAHAGMMNASAEQLAAVLGQQADTGEEVEIWRLFGCLTMEVVGSTAFGVELQTVKNHAEFVARDVSKIRFDSADSDATRLLKSLAVQFAFAGPADSVYALCSLLFPDAALLFRFLGTYLPDAGLRKQLQARRQMRAVCYKLISRARQAGGSLSTRDGAASRSDDGWEQITPQPRSSPPPGGFISHLLSSENQLLGRRFTDTEVAAQAFTFIMGGYETTASALAFAVHFIAQHPHVEAKLLAEVDAFGREAAPTYDSCDQFPYLDAVLNETLRLLPPISLGTIREARTRMCLRGYDIPKGAYINAAIFSFQNNDKYWEDAKAFKPERFLAKPDNSERASAPPAFCAFGDGGRACVGVKFAKANAKIALIRLYQRFTLKLTPGQLPLAVHTNLTMAPMHGVKVLVQRRL